MKNITKNNYVMVMHYFALLVIPSYTLGTFLPDLLISLSALIFLIYSIKKKIFKYYNNNYFKIIFVFWIYITANSLFSEKIITSLIPSFFFIRFIIFSLLIWFLLENSKNFSLNLFYLLLVTFSFVTIHALAQHFFNIDIFLMNFSNFSLIQNFNNISCSPINSCGDFVDYRVSGIFYTEQILASFLLRTFPIFLITFFLVNINYKKNNALFFLVITLTFLTIIVTGERANIALCFIFLLTTFIFFKYSKNFNKFLFFFFLILIFIFVVKTNPNVERRLITNTIASLYGGKTNFEFNFFSEGHHGHITSAIKMFKQKPINGYGVKMYRYECLKEKYKDIKYGCTTHPHNTYFQLLAETGIIGFSFIVFFASWSLFFFLRLVTNYKRNFYNPLLIATSIILINLFPFITTGSFFHNGLSMLYFMPIGFFMFLKNKYYNE